MGQFKFFFPRRKDAAVGTSNISSGEPFCCAWSNLVRFRETLYQVVCVVQPTTFASEFPNTIMTRRCAIPSELETSNIYAPITVDIFETDWHHQQLCMHFQWTRLRWQGFRLRWVNGMNLIAFNFMRAIGTKFKYRNGRCIWRNLRWIVDNAYERYCKIY